MNKSKVLITRLLTSVGVKIDGELPYEPQVLNENVYERIVKGGSLAAGESFMDMSWDVESLDELISRLLKQSKRWRFLLRANFLSRWLSSRLFNRQRGGRAYEVGTAHYDLGNDLYQAMLDKRMIYTCAYWKDSDNLDEAQEAKLDLICRKLNLQPGDRVLDIGCGWGGLMKYMAEKYKVSCVGLSVSKEQTAYAKQVCAGLPTEFYLTDYQKFEPTELFDHIVSIEMFEAVGQKNYRTFMDKASQWLNKDGSMLLQTIGSNSSLPLTDPWIDKYIFPNGILPNKKQIDKSVSGLFKVADWHSIGKDYDKTLMAWWYNFEANYASLNHIKYDERFYRMWKYYLQMCAGSFRAGHIDDWQILLIKKVGMIDIQPVR